MYTARNSERLRAMRDRDARQVATSLDNIVAYRVTQTLPKSNKRTIGEFDVHSYAEALDACEEIRNTPPCYAVVECLYGTERLTAQEIYA